MLELAGMTGAILLNYMQAQGLLGDRGLEDYTPGHLDPPITVIDGGDPIASGSLATTFEPLSGTESNPGIPAECFS
jgi:hypothetical protein